jgi:predicted transcriptional regulator
MSEIEKFRNEVERYLTETGVTPTQFGKDFAGDPLFVFQLRKGREPRTETRQRILDAMQTARAAA